ncbi:MAG TPA: caspase family protein [Pyrinomonadaceae bacterium]|nr:caspase family protein [Pyrinomonadaceae bacterium]
MTIHQVLRQVIAALLLGLLHPLASNAQETANPKLLIQSGHRGAVNDVSYSPNGSLIATAGDDRKIKLWDATSRKLLNDLEGHSGEVSAIDFSPDGRLLVSAGENNEVFLWDVQSGRLIRGFRGHGSGVNSVAFSPDGKTLATTGGKYQDVSDNSIRIWDVQTGRQLRLLGEHSSAVRHADFALNGRALVSYGFDKTIKIWRLPEGQLLNSLTTADYIDTMSVLPDGQSFATVSSKVLTVWDIQGRSLRALDLSTPTNAIAFSKDGRTFAFYHAEERSVELRAFPSNQLVSRLNGVIREANEDEFDLSVNKLNFSPDGKVLILGTSEPTVQLWNRDTARLVATLTPTAESVGVLAVSRDGKTFAVGSGKKIIFWDSQSAKPRRVLPGHSDLVLDLAFNHDSTLLASVSSQEGVKLWSTTSGQLLWSFRGRDDDLRCVLFSPDGRSIATAGENLEVKLLNSRGGSLIRTLTLPRNASTLSSGLFIKASFERPVSGPNYVLSLAFSPDGTLLAAGDLSFPINIWDVRTGNHLRTIRDRQENANSLVFSFDGKTLIAGHYEKAVKFWSVSSGELVRPINERASVQSVALDPSGAFLATSTSAGTISLRLSSDGSLIRDFNAHTSAINTVAFSRNGKILISGSDDGTTKLWSAGDGRLLLSLVSFEDGNWLTYTPEGFYDSSGGALKYISWWSGNRNYNAAQYHSRFSRPEIAKDRLSSAVAPSILATTNITRPVPKPDVIASTGSMEESLKRDLPSKKFYALVIGNNNYNFKHLKTAVKDAEDVAKILNDDFGFQITLLRNATRTEIMREINRLKRDLDGDSNLLIYYAGHGYLDNRVNRAYWWPVNASPEDSTEWISADDITISLKGMDARHVLVVSDSCYSGAIPRAGEVVGTSRLTERERYIRKMMSGTSRTLIASGGVEPVEDNSGNGHSVFANAFLNGLRRIENNPFTAEELFYDYIRIPVAGKSPQTPQFDPLYNSGHDSGGFVFFKKRSR